MQSPKRKPVTKKLRFEVFKRDNFTCQYCSAKPPSVVLEIDHVLPVCKKGTNDIENLITACFDCNRGKGKEALSSIPETLVEKSKRKKEALKQYKDYLKTIEADNEIQEEAVDLVQEIWRQSFPDYFFSGAFRNSVRKFNSELGISIVMDAMRYSCSKFYLDREETLRYFCGVCWGKIYGRKFIADE